MAMEKWFVVLLLWVCFALGIEVGKNAAHLYLPLSHLCFILLAALVVPKSGITRKMSKEK
jgi:hypothetical protein